MTRLRLTERLWGSLAHVPIITLIWVGYLLYRYITDHAFIENIMQINSITSHSPPLTPILLTLLGIPISLTIMHLKKKSLFIHDNAQEAYLFNIWLLKKYGLLFIASFVGIYLACKPILLASTIAGGVISLVCLMQSIIGITTALNGKVYHYWYPGSKIG